MSNELYKIAEGNIESLEEQGTELVERGFIPAGPLVLLPKMVEGYHCFAQAFYCPMPIDPLLRPSVKEESKPLKPCRTENTRIRLEKGVKRWLVFTFTGERTKLVAGKLQVTVNVIEHPNAPLYTQRLTIGLEKHLLCSYLQQEENLTSAEDLDNFVQTLADDCQQMEYVQFADDTTVLREYRP